MARSYARAKVARLPGYLTHFSDGGAGMRNSDEPLEEGQEIRDGVNGTYRVERIR